MECGVISAACQIVALCFTYADDKFFKEISILLKEETDFIEPQLL